MDAWCRAKLLSMAGQAGQVLRYVHFALLDADLFKKRTKKRNMKNGDILFPTDL